MKKVLIVDDVEGWRTFHKNAVNIVLGDNILVDTAESAENGYNKVLENNNSPYDIILTDLQMESDFEPLYAGEWFVERIKEIRTYYKTKIVIISATYNIKNVAERQGVFCIPKAMARNFPDSYDFLANK